MASENGRAQSLAEDLDKRYPLDNQMQSLWLPAIRARTRAASATAPFAFFEGFAENNQPQTGLLNPPPFLINQCMTS